MQQALGSTTNGFMPRTTWLSCSMSTTAWISAERWNTGMGPSFRLATSISRARADVARLFLLHMSLLPMVILSRAFSSCLVFGADTGLVRFFSMNATTMLLQLLFKRCSDTLPGDTTPRGSEKLQVLQYFSMEVQETEIDPTTSPRGNNICCRCIPPSTLVIRRSSVETLQDLANVHRGIKVQRLLHIFFACRLSSLGRY